MESAWERTGVEPADVVNALRVVELSVETRPAAIRALVEAANLEQEGIDPDKAVEAVEQRESTAHTIVEKGFALPHAMIDWADNWRVVLGRSRAGVEYAAPDCGRVHLVALFVAGARLANQRRLQVLAALGELFREEEFRDQLVRASDTHHIEQLLLARARSTSGGQTRTSAGVPRINTILVRQAIELVEVVSAQALLLAVDTIENVPWKPLDDWQGRLLVVTAGRSDDFSTERPNTHLFDVAHTRLTRMDQANLGLLLAASAGLLVDDADVVCITGPGGRQLDSVTVARPKSHLQAMFSGRTTRRSTKVPPAIILRALSLAIELAAEGREGQPVGTMFVIGDAYRVMQHARQLVLNPFRGYSRSLRNLLDPSLAETMKEFALIDGAFVVEADGTVLGAGIYLTPHATKVRLPPGLGARHQVAAAITAHTQAMAITVSQSTGAVTLFRNGQIVLKLEKGT